MVCLSVRLVAYIHVVVTLCHIVSCWSVDMLICCFYLVCWCAVSNS